MTLPNPGVSLSLSEIQTEFGGTNPASLNEYYAGGSYVSAGTTGYYGAIPSSGAISISDFYGAPAVALTNHTIRVQSPGIATGGNVRVTFNNTGTAVGSGVIGVGNVIIDGNTVSLSQTRTFNVANGYASNQWLAAGTASLYDIYATWTVVLPGGTLTGDSTSTWLNLGTTRYWDWADGSNDSNGTLSITIALAADHATVVDTCDINLITNTAG